MTRWMGLAALAVVVMGTAAGAIGAADPNFDGLGTGFSGPSGSMTVSTATPDPSIAVGPNHIVQAAGGYLAVFDKTGATVAGPSPVLSLWMLWDSVCATGNDGAATVVYDGRADRWIVAHVAETTSCVAVSQTADPAGSYTHYTFPLTAVPISNTLTAWQDAYIGVFERAAGAAAAGGSTVCAYDRTRILAGLPATQQCFEVAATGVLPADLDGSAPAGATPAFLLSLGSDHESLDLRMLRVDWATPANSAITDPLALSVQPWSDPDPASIPQSDGPLLASGAGRLMRRVVYRTFDDGHSSIVANHTVATAGGAGVRWYEVQIPGGTDATPALAQQGTWAPDADTRWLGAIGMDAAGNIALAYNASSESIVPGIRYTGRLAADPAGEMPQGEGSIVAGAGAQDASAWGRFSAMAQDPDGCRFWATGEYLSDGGTLNWRTRVASFGLPGCSPETPDDFSITLTPVSATATGGGTVQTTVDTAVTSGSVGTLFLTVSGLPSGATASFNPSSVAAGGSSVLSVTAGLAAAGAYSLVVTASDGTTTHTAAFELTVTSPPPPDFTLSIAPPSRTIMPGGSTTYVVSSQAINGSAQSIALSASGLPSGVDAQFSPATITAGGLSTLTLTVPGTTPTGSTIFTVTGTSGATVHSATSTLTLEYPNPVRRLANNAPVSTRGAKGTDQYFVLTVPPDQDALTFTMTGGSGNADLYVRYGDFPTALTFACRPQLNTSNETCTFVAPQAGEWFAMIRGVTNYSGVSLTGAYTADSTTALTNGVPVSPISAATGQSLYWKLLVPAGQQTLTFKISGGTGDADLYVRRGSKPTTTSYECRPYLTGNSETCSFSSPVSAVYYVMLRAFTTFSGVTLVGTYTADLATPLLTNNVPVTGISGATGSQQFWRLPVPAGVTSVTVTMSGGTGDADLYVRRGSKPTTNSWNCRPYLNGNNETCTLSNSGANDYYVMIRGFTAFSGVTLKGSY